MFIYSKYKVLFENMKCAIFTKIIKLLKMRYLIILVLVIYSLPILAQDQETQDNLLTGKLVLTKDGMTIGASQKLTKETDIDFEYNGKELSVQIGTKVYNDVTLAAGIGIQPNGEGCVYMSLSDGIALGDIETSGTSPYESEQLVKVKSTGALKAALGGKVSYCVNWINNKPMTFKPTAGNFQKVLTMPNIANSILSILHSLKFEPDFAIQYSREGDIGFSLNEGEEKEIESYCLEWEKDRPNSSTQYTVIENSEVSAVMKTLKEDTFLEVDIQEMLWKHNLLNNFGEQYISGSAIYKNKKEAYTYGSLTFIDNMEVFYFPKHESQLLIKSFETQKRISYIELLLSPPAEKELANGDIILIFSNDPELLETFEQHKEFNFEYIVDMVNK